MLKIEDISVLIVDDMKSMRMTIRKMLRNLGIGNKLHLANDGNEALNILNNFKYDLIILDLNMPVMNGYEFLENIRKDKILRDLPVIMVTAKADRDVVYDIAEVEVEAYLLKPLTLDSLDTKIRTVIDKVNNPDLATKYRMKAKEFEEKKDYKSAIEQTKIALSSKPYASRLLREFGLLHLKINQDSIAEKCLKKAVMTNKYDMFSRIYLADYYIKKQELGKAGNLYLEILALSKKFFDKALIVGEKLLAKGSRNLAFDIFTSIIDRSDNYKVKKKKILDICLKYNEYDYPHSMLDQMIQENPLDYDFMFKAATIYKLKKDMQNALMYFRNVDSHYTNHIPSKMNIAKILYENKQIYEADEYLRQILNIDPENKEAKELQQQI